jgi:hypothetical protein
MRKDIKVCVSDEPTHFYYYPSTKCLKLNWFDQQIQGAREDEEEDEVVARDTDKTQRAVTVTNRTQMHCNSNRLQISRILYGLTIQNI